MTGTALHTNEMLFLLQRLMQDVVLNKIVIAFTEKNLIQFVLISTDCIFINMHICDVLLNVFVSVYCAYKTWENIETYKLLLSCL